MHRRRVLEIALAGVGVSIAGCLDREEPTGPPGEEDPELIEIEDDRLVREHADTDEERVWVAGTAVNTSDQELTLVEIAATFFDVEGEQLDRTVEHIDDVTSGFRWEFEIEYPHVGEQASLVDAYELDIVTNI